MRKSYIIPVLAIGLLLSACASQEPRVQMPREERASRPAPTETPVVPGKAEDPADGGQPGKVGTGVPPLDLAYLDKRLFAYEEKILQWQAVDEQLANGAAEIEVSGQWQQCLRYVGILHDHYDRLREQVAFAYGPDLLAEDPVDPWDVLRADISYLESDCDAVYGRMHEKLANLEKEQLEPARMLEGVVADYVENMQYKDALQAYRSLERRFPGWQPSLNTRHAHGLALLHTGQIDKAGPVLREILPQLEPAAQLSVKRLVADILWVTHRFEEARALYLSLSHHFASWKENEHWVAEQLAILENVDNRSPEMVAYMSLLRLHLAFDGRHVPAGLEKEVARITNNFPGSMIDQRAQQILRRTQERARGWIEDQLASATALKEQKEFAKAVAILNLLQRETLPAETGLRVEQLKKEVLLVEAEEKERERFMLQQDIASRWEEASHLLDLGFYDEANIIFVTLLGTDYEDQARSRMREASNRAASEMRREAANLFIRARESGNPERKMDFLLESRRLLSTIMERYPEADVINNAHRNLQVIEQHISELRPNQPFEAMQVQE